MSVCEWVRACDLPCSLGWRLLLVVVVSQYAPWCVWCQRLHPTWEAFAENMEEEKIPVKVVKVRHQREDALAKSMTRRGLHVFHHSRRAGSMAGR